MVGDLESVDRPLHEISRKARIAILSLDYALAPEHSYPIAREQCEDAVRWSSVQQTALGLAPGPLGIGGDSAGGNMAALLALHFRDEGNSPIGWQLLINPVLDFPGVEAPHTASHRAFAAGPILNLEVMKSFNAAYFKDEAAKLEASPFSRRDFANLPSAFIAAAECDPLRDDATSYADHLKEAGVRTSLKIYEGMCHNFITMAHTSTTARSLIDDIAAAAARGMRPTSD